jgi:hypothetical protein
VIKTKTCTNCGKTKPSTQFKRRLTIAQSRAMLRNPNINKAYVTTSKRCKDCQPKRHTPLSTKQIRSKITTGDIHKTMGESMLEERRKAIPKTRSRIMKEYWEKKRSGWVKPLKQSIQAQVQTYRNRYNAYKTTLRTKLNATPPQLTTSAQHATLVQHGWNYKEARRVRDKVFKEVDEGVQYATGFKIQTLMKPMKYNHEGEEA